MSERYILSDEARDDLLEIWFYVFSFHESDGDADQKVRRIYEIFAMLAERPNLGRPRDWLDADQLAFPKDGYFVVYRRLGSRIEISRVTGADEDVALNH